MIHNWLRHLDNPGKYLRVCFLDFSKAFDRTDHNIVITKLINLVVRKSLIPWICSFLSGRTQFVNVCHSTSNWTAVTAGLPQGTKLEPILFFITVNDLISHSPMRSSSWMYVDDLTISEAIHRNSPSSTQVDLHSIIRWSAANNVTLNPKCARTLLYPFFEFLLRSCPPLCISAFILWRRSTAI